MNLELPAAVPLESHAPCQVTLQRSKSKAPPAPHSGRALSGGSLPRIRLRETFAPVPFHSWDWVWDGPRSPSLILGTTVSLYAFWRPIFGIRTPNKGPGSTTGI